SRQILAGGSRRWSQGLRNIRKSGGFSQPARLGPRIANSVRVAGNSDCLTSLVTSDAGSVTASGGLVRPYLRCPAGAVRYGTESWMDDVPFCVPTLKRKPTQT